MNDRNKTVIITGAAQGIGLVTTQMLGSIGYNIVAVDKDKEAMEEVEEVFSSFSNISFLHADISKESDVKEIVKSTKEKHKHIYGIVNNAGKTKNIPLEKLTLDDWNEVFSTNITGAFLLIKYASPFLKESKGRIINIGSTRALMSEANTEAYSASKGALLALTHALAVSLASHVNVNIISPGWIDVSMYKKADDRRPAELTDEQHFQHPAGRVGTPEDVAYMVEYLLSDKADFITGQNFTIDGGMTKKMIYI
jgi:NAD(P)-dependent dehydrogenase (short-subunit alcohol dehydrogenase family)